MQRPGFNLSSCLFNNWWANVGTDDFAPGKQGCRLLWGDKTGSASKPGLAASTKGLMVLPPKTDPENDPTTYVLLIALVAVIAILIYRQS